MRLRQLLKGLAKRTQHSSQHVSVYEPQASGALGRRPKTSMEDFEWYRYRRRWIAAFSLGLLLADDERAGKRGKTRQWIKRRQEKGFFANIVQELMVADVVGYREMLRMKPADFHTILR